MYSEGNEAGPPAPAGRDRAPIWNKAIARMMGQRSNDGEAGASRPQRARVRMDEKLLQQLGLPNLVNAPEEPRLLSELLKQDDAVDAKADLDEFSRGIRRSVRIHIALKAKLHHTSGKTWREWVASEFDIGYECYQRWYRTAELQMALLQRGLPPLTSERQSRALMPLSRHEKFYEALGAESFKGGYPSSGELRTQVEKALGLTQAVDMPMRIQLHRKLEAIVQNTAAGEDQLVAQALGLVARAVGLLANGGATS